MHYIKMESHFYCRGLEAYFDHNEGLYGCLGLTDVIPDTE